MVDLKRQVGYHPIAPVTLPRHRRQRPRLDGLGNTDGLTIPPHRSMPGCRWKPDWFLQGHRNPRFPCHADCKQLGVAVPINVRSLDGGVILVSCLKINPCKFAADQCTAAMGDA
jgi:hypothetical protein